MSVAELKTGLRNAAAQDGIPAQRMKHMNASVKAAKNVLKLVASAGEEVEPWHHH